MGNVGLFVLGLVFGVVAIFIGVVVIIETDHQWIPLIVSAICGLMAAGICILVSRHSLKVQVEEFNSAKTVYEEALANDDLSGLERIEIVEKIVEENKWLAKTKYNVKQWYCWFLPDEIVDGLEEIKVSKK